MGTPHSRLTYYNDNDAHCCAWLHNLIEGKLLTAGHVDSRNIKAVTPADLQEYNRIHLFAGIGGWEQALNLASWPLEVPVLTGSCPCQPFSIAGNQQGVEDERHLWPEMLRLIRESKIDFVFGEQVASPLGRDWLARVQTDLEALGFVFGASDLCVAGLGAPHIRQRLYWVAHTQNADRRWSFRTQDSRRRSTEVGGSDTRMGESNSDGCSKRDQTPSGARHRNTVKSAGFWDDSEWTPCRDLKKGIVYRRVESGLQPLVNGIPFQLANGRTKEGASRTQLLKGIGNSVSPPLAAIFIRAFMESV